MVQFFEDLKGVGAPPLTPQERQELSELRTQAAELRKKIEGGKNQKKSKADSSCSDSEEEVLDLKPIVKP